MDIFSAFSQKPPNGNNVTPYIRKPPRPKTGNESVRKHPKLKTGLTKWWTRNNEHKQCCTKALFKSHLRTQYLVQVPSAVSQRGEKSRPQSSIPKEANRPKRILGAEHEPQLSKLHPDSLMSVVEMRRLHGYYMDRLPDRRPATARKAEPDSYTADGIYMFGTVKKLDQSERKFRTRDKYEKPQEDFAVKTAFVDDRKDKVVFDVCTYLTECAEQAYIGRYYDRHSACYGTHANLPKAYISARTPKVNGKPMPRKNFQCSRCGKMIPTAEVFGFEHAWPSVERPFLCTCEISARRPKSAPSVHKDIPLYHVLDRPVSELLLELDRQTLEIKTTLTRGTIPHYCNIAQPATLFKKFLTEESFDEEIYDADIRGILKKHAVAVQDGDGKLPEELTDEAWPDLLATPPDGSGDGSSQDLDDLVEEVLKKRRKPGRGKPPYKPGSRLDPRHKRLSIEEKWASLVRKLWDKAGIVSSVDRMEGKAKQLHRREKKTRKDGRHSVGVEGGEDMTEHMTDHTTDHMTDHAALDDRRKSNVIQSVRRLIGEKTFLRFFQHLPQAFGAFGGDGDDDEQGDLFPIPTLNIQDEEAKGLNFQAWNEFRKSAVKLRSLLELAPAEGFLMDDTISKASLEFYTKFKLFLSDAWQRDDKKWKTDKNEISKSYSKHKAEAFSKTWKKYITLMEKAKLKIKKTTTDLHGDKETGEDKAAAASGVFITAGVHGAMLVTEDIHEDTVTATGLRGDSLPTAKLDTNEYATAKLIATMDASELERYETDVARSWGNFLHTSVSVPNARNPQETSERMLGDLLLETFRTFDGTVDPTASLDLFHNFKTFCMDDVEVDSTDPSTATTQELSAWIAFRKSTQQLDSVFFHDLRHGSQSTQDGSVDASGQASGHPLLVSPTAEFTSKLSLNRLIEQGKPWGSEMMNDEASSDDASSKYAGYMEEDGSMQVSQQESGALLGDERGKKEREIQGDEATPDKGALEGDGSLQQVRILEDDVSKLEADTKRARRSVNVDQRPTFAYATAVDHGMTAYAETASPRIVRGTKKDANWSQRSLDQERAGTESTVTSSGDKGERRSITEHDRNAKYEKPHKKSLAKREKKERKKLDPANKLRQAKEQEMVQETVQEIAINITGVEEAQELEVFPQVVQYKENILQAEGQGVTYLKSKTRVRLRPRKDRPAREIVPALQTPGALKIPNIFTKRVDSWHRPEVVGLDTLRKLAQKADYDDDGDEDEDWEALFPSKSVEQAQSSDVFAQDLYLRKSSDVVKMTPALRRHIQLESLAKQAKQAANKPRPRPSAKSRQKRAICVKEFDGDKVVQRLLWLSDSDEFEDDGDHAYTAAVPQFELPLSLWACRFSLPNDLHTLETMPIHEYLTQFVTPSPARKQLYKLMFYKHMEHDHLNNHQLRDAIKSVLASHVNTMDIEKVLKIVGVEPDWEVGVKLFSGIAAVTERMVFPRFIKIYQNVIKGKVDKTDLEKCDFQSWLFRTEGLKFPENMRVLMNIIIVPSHSGF